MPVSSKPRRPYNQQRRASRSAGLTGRSRTSRLELCRVSGFLGTPIALVPRNPDRPRDLHVPAISEKFECRKPHAFGVGGETGGKVKRACCNSYRCQNRRNLKAREVSDALVKHWTDGSEGVRFIYTFNTDRDWETFTRYARNVRANARVQEWEGQIPTYVGVKENAKDPEFPYDNDRFVVSSICFPHMEYQTVSCQEALDELVEVILSHAHGISNPDWTIEKPESEYFSVDLGFDFEIAEQIVRNAGFTVTGRDMPEGSGSTWDTDCSYELSYVYPEGMTKDEAKVALLAARDEVLGSKDADEYGDLDDYDG